MGKVMSKLFRFALAALFLAYAISVFAADRTGASAPVNMPLVIEVNRGQTAPQVKYLARSREGVLFFTAQGVTVAPPRVGAFRMLFENAAGPEIAPEQKLISRSNYLAAEPARRITGVENYGALLYSGLYPGIDVRFYGQGRHLEHDFLLSPGADPAQISLRFEGLDHVALTSAGDLELTLGKFHLRETAPVAWQMVMGKKQQVAANWKMAGDGRAGITLGAYDRGLPVTIDPVLVYATHLGGSTAEDLDLGATFPADTAITHIALDGNRNIYVGGTTSAVDYPTTAGAFDRTPSTQEVFHEDPTTQSGFVSKFDPTGKILLYSTFLRVSVQAMWVDSVGHVYSSESQFVEDPGPNFGFDEGIWIDKLSQDGSRLLFSRGFAQTNSNSPSCQVVTDSFVHGLIADNSGHVWVVGSTANPCLPATAGAFQSKLPNTSGSGFVAKFNTNTTPANSLVYSTYLGGSASSGEADQVAIDASGNAYVTGFTDASNFPHGASFGSGSTMTFVSKLNPTGTGLVFSTVLHGTAGFPGVGGIAIDSAHNVYVAGTATIGFPTTVGAFQRVSFGANCQDNNGNRIPCNDGFVTKLSPGGGSLIYSTLLGGSGTDQIRGLGLNNAGMAFVTGDTNSGDFPFTGNGFKKFMPAGATNGFVSAFQPDGKTLYYSTLLGGSRNSSGLAIFIDPAWNAWVGGTTQDTDFPVTPDAFQPGLKGNSDGFIAKIVIAGDLRASLTGSTAAVARNAVVTFSAQVSNIGPDGSDAVVLTDPIPSGFSFAGISGSTATSCSVPAVGATTGSVVCHRTRLEPGASFGVNINLRAIAASGARLTNKVSTSARTQDLNQANNTAQASVLVR
jgi:uncharacterized repeat protein (TIGR01451 family)